MTYNLVTGEIQVNHSIYGQNQKSDLVSTHRTMCSFIGGVGVVNWVFRVVGQLRIEEVRGCRGSLRG